MRFRSYLASADHKSRPDNVNSFDLSETSSSLDPKAVEWTRPAPELELGHDPCPNATCFPMGDPRAFAGINSFLRQA